MLKIKDNVDLKELEKFRFKKDKWGDLVKEYEPKHQLNAHCVGLMIDRTDNNHINRIGYCADEAYCFDIELDTLYDLIKADIVEKVNDATKTN